MSTPTTAADSDTSFFEKERDRLAGEIASGFEQLLSSTNGLNRKLEEVLGMTKEYDTIAALWSSFHQLMRTQQADEAMEEEERVGMPGTGGYVVTGKGDGGG